MYHYLTIFWKTSNVTEAINISSVLTVSQLYLCVGSKPLKPNISKDEKIAFGYLLNDLILTYSDKVNKNTLGKKIKLY